MRETKFRGKSKFKNVWHYGSLINNAFFLRSDDSAIPYILDTDDIDYDNFVDIAEQLDDFEVVPESVGQYTGLKDIEQFEEPKELYIGDIVSMHQFLFDGDEYEEEITGVLTYNEDIAAVCLTKIKHHDIRKFMGYETDIDGFKKEQIPVCMFYGLHESSWTYLGNIFEHSHLLEQHHD